MLELGVSIAVKQTINVLLRDELLESWAIHGISLGGGLDQIQQELSFVSQQDVRVRFAGDQFLNDGFKDISLVEASLNE